MKKKNKGFVMAEVIVVSAVVIGALVIIYSQFVSIINSYNNSFKYNTVEDLYSVNNISSYLKTDGLETLKTELVGLEYLDITNCSTSYVTERAYCQSLLQNLNIKTVLFTKEDITEFKKQAPNIDIFDEGLKKFVKFIKPKKEANKYRLIVEFNDETYATLKINEG